MFSFPEPILGSLEWACQEHLGLSSITCRLALGVFTHQCTNGVLLCHQIASVMPSIQSQTTLSQCAHTSDTSRGGWSDGSGWRYSILAKHHHSQHLIRSFFFLNAPPYEEEVIKAPIFELAEPKKLFEQNNFIQNYNFVALNMQFTYYCSVSHLLHS